MTDKRSRGRPRGTGKDDQPFLAMVADLMVKTPGLKPTTAIKRVVATRKDWNGASDTAVIRRWQVKWSAEGEALLSAARERAAPKPAPSGGGYVPSYAGIGAFGWMDRHLQDMRRMQDMIDPPHLRAFRQIEENERRMRDLIDPPYLRAVRRMQEDQKRIDDLINPPWLQAHRRMEESMRRMDPFYNMSLSMKAALGII